MRQETDRRPIECLDIMFKKGGLGDSVARLPAVNYILVKNPHIKKARLFLQDYFVEMANILLKPHVNRKRLRIYGYSEMEAQLKAQREAMMAQTKAMTEAIAPDIRRTTGATLGAQNLGVRTSRARRQATAATVGKGISSLRIPLNIGGTGGGLNIG